MGKRDDGFVSASELARLGYCERQVAFDATFGRSTTAPQRKAQERGQHAHDVFYEESLRIAAASAKKGRCFVATLALGECAETNALRAFRDLYLRRSVVGRLFIAAYYACSPAACRWLKSRPAAVRVARAMLRPLARAAAATVARRLARS